MASDRAETGPMQFGEDWPGVFIRGDNAAYYGMQLRQLLSLDSSSDLIARAVLADLAETLEGSHVAAPTVKQALAPFPDCQAELSAAREMREVLGLCLPCIDEEIHDPRTLVDRRDSLTVLRRRVARLIGGDRG